MWVKEFSYLDVINARGGAGAISGAVVFNDIKEDFPSK